MSSACEYKQNVTRDEHDMSSACEYKQNVTRDEHDMTKNYYLFWTNFHEQWLITCLSNKIRAVISLEELTPSKAKQQD